MKDQDTAVSIEFERAFASNSSGCRRECYCGRVHFDTYNKWDWEEGELEELEARQAKEPDRYIGEGNSIGSYELMGHEIVLGCKCNTGARYEDFLIRHAREIATYLNERADRLQKEADEMRIRTAK